jgi:hypothetical protein
MKTLSYIVALVLTAISANASFISTNQVGAARTNVMLTSASQLYQLTCVNAGTVSVAIAFFDVGSTNLTYTNGVYSNIVSSVVSATNIYTDFTGKSVTNYWNVLTNTWSTTAAATNNRSAILNWTIPTNTTFVYKPAISLSVGRGLLFTNNDSISVTVEYGHGY